jgi:hypothetical protein
MRQGIDRKGMSSHLRSVARLDQFLPFRSNRAVTESGAHFIPGIITQLAVNLIERIFKVTQQFCSTSRPDDSQSPFRSGKRACLREFAVSVG